MSSPRVRCKVVNKHNYFSMHIGHMIHMIQSTFYCLQNSTASRQSLRIVPWFKWKLFLGSTLVTCQLSIYDWFIRSSRTTNKNQQNNIFKTWVLCCSLLYLAVKDIFKFRVVGISFLFSAAWECPANAVYCCQ